MNSEFCLSYKIHLCNLILCSDPLTKLDHTNQLSFSRHHYNQSPPIPIPTCGWVVHPEEKQYVHFMNFPGESPSDKVHAQMDGCCVCMVGGFGEERGANWKRGHQL